MMKTEEEILRIDDLKDLIQLRYTDLKGRFLSEKEINHIFKLCGALWLHSGDTSQPHAKLTSGKCSNGFIDVLRVLCNTNLCEIFAHQMVLKLIDYDTTAVGIRGKVNWVVGSDHAGAVISHSVATILNTLHDFTEKGPDHTQVWKRFLIEPFQSVLQVEELITTIGTLRAVHSGIRDGNVLLGNSNPVIFYPAVLTLVHRAQEYTFEGHPILYLIHYDIKTWEPSECPLCANGSKPVSPKHNWQELTGG